MAALDCSGILAPAKRILSAPLRVMGRFGSISVGGRKTPEFLNAPEMPPKESVGVQFGGRGASRFRSTRKMFEVSLPTRPKPAAGTKSSDGGNGYFDISQRTPATSGVFASHRKRQSRFLRFQSINTGPKT